MMPLENVLENPSEELSVQDYSDREFVFRSLGYNSFICVAIITAFPPLEQISEPLELADPWEGVRTFAEDFYISEDLREGLFDPATGTPSQFTSSLGNVEAQGEELNDYHSSEASSRAQTKEPSFLDVDMLEDEDEKDEDFAPDASPDSSKNEQLDELSIADYSRVAHQEIPMGSGKSNA